MPIGTEVDRQIDAIRQFGGNDCSWMCGNTTPSLPVARSGGYRVSIRMNLRLLRYVGFESFAAVRIAKLAECALFYLSDSFLGETESIAKLLE